MPVATPMDYVSSLASELKISGETEAKTLEILNSAYVVGIASGREPRGMAATAICLAEKITNDRDISKEVISKVGITKFTFDHRYKDLEDLLSKQKSTEKTKAAVKVQPA